MAITLQQAKDVLRLDNDYNDSVIAPLVEAVPYYIHTTTGMTLEQQEGEPLATTVGGFLIQLWFNAEGTDVDRLMRVIESLLKTLSVRASELNE
ncbi:phage gp6-like head-tail connector protein [Tuanshanicoccus lijuaniae]|uniref:hypothetical protein n=1 Tax=Aerococcaceae bacterium zg-1292 TaxID=2774330 RepID=UPI001938DD91|nr:phage gp6-like head-tail connector protein [Aerococcaceae bacterium zg-1292]MBS4456317.1 phage gp6-like head-tail connector protein [Aerococcaceae bacterium zg-A91]MBS4458096.1 phage gp6-like head-tail connector protein [Aerococcaceae bacterium zg-BR33]MBS4458750.1 phage gp6-like head-tail connector protein [Aerococcaceae bacterium zg-BR33]QQA37531.1 phage gp6-like head-tail connector protein [Aerococcaceae bacterium zg-1292]